MNNNHANKEFKRLINTHRDYMSDKIRKFNKSRTPKEKALKIQYLAKKLGRLTADLYNLQSLIYPEGE
jgi:hypothetical protein